jgi:hypothetical protein
MAHTCIIVSQERPVERPDLPSSALGLTPERDFSSPGRTDRYEAQTRCEGNYGAAGDRSSPPELSRRPGRDEVDGELQDPRVRRQSRCLLVVDPRSSIA